MGKHYCECFDGAAFCKAGSYFIITGKSRTGIYYLANRQKKIIALILGLLSLLFFISVVNYVMNGSPTYDFMKPFIENNVLCYIPDVNFQKQIVSAGEHNSLQTIGEYISDHLLIFIKLSLLKFLSFWEMVRSYYSTVHNVCLLCFFCSLYFFAAVGMRKATHVQKYLM